MPIRSPSTKSAGNVSHLHLHLKYDTNDSPDYIVYDVWLAVEFAVVYFMFVETNNMSLEQTATLLDGVDAKDKLVDMVAKNAAHVDHVHASPEKNIDG